jgi:hypothetical protein
VRKKMDSIQIALVRKGNLTNKSKARQKVKIKIARAKKKKIIKSIPLEEEAIKRENKTKP